MGKPKAPKVKYIPAPPPPVTVKTPTQSLKTQIELAKVSGEQNRLNMETGANLDRINEEFYTGQDLRRYRARGAEERQLAQTKGAEDRATLGIRGREERLTVGARGAQDRLTVGERGRQTRATQAQLLAGQERQIGLRGQEERRAIGARGTETRATQAQLLSGQERQIGLRGSEERQTTRVRGEEQRAGIRESGSETRRTALQQEAFRRYKENRDYQQAQSAYKS